MKEFYTIKKGYNNVFRVFLLLLLMCMASVLMVFIFNPELYLYEKLFIFAIYFALFVVFLKNNDIGFYSLAIIVPFNLLIGIIFPIAAKFNLFPVDLVIGMLLAVWIIGILNNEVHKFKKTKLDLFLIVLIIVSVISIFPYLFDIINEISKSPIQLTSYLIFKQTYSTKLLFSLNMLFRVVLYVLFYFYIVNNIDTARIKRFFTVLISSFFIISMVSIASYAASASNPVKFRLDGGHPNSRILVDSEFYNRRSSFPFPHPNTLAGYSLLNMSIPITLFIFSRKLRTKLLWGLILLMFVCGFAFTQSRAASLGISVSAFIAFALLMLKFRQGLFKVSAGVVLIMLLIFSFLVLDLRGLTDVYKSAEYDLDEKYKATLEITTRPEGRVNLIWPTTINIIKDNFLIGIGQGMYSKEYENYLSKRNVRYTNEIHAHNFYLHAFAELGVIGFVIYALIFYIALKTALLYIINKSGAINKSNKSRAINWDYCIVFSIFIGIAALLIHSFFDNLLFWREIAVLFWMQTGFLFVIAGK